MNSILQELISLLDLEPLELNLFRGQSRNLGGRSVFGGQVISQALVAADRTVDAARPVHSLHAYFLRPGDMAAPIVYEVDRVREGRSFATRRVQAIQHGEVILTMIASFQKAERGFEHQQPMPQAPPPESLRSFTELAADWLQECKDVPPGVRTWLERPIALEFKPVDPRNPMRAEKRAPEQMIWLRIPQTLPDDPALHRQILAFASDFSLMGTAFLPHGMAFGQPDFLTASIDHALWFHRELRVDDWLLYVMDSPSAQAARGLARGSIFDRRGRLVASVAQEGLMRYVGPNPPY